MATNTQIEANGTTESPQAGSPGWNKTKETAGKAAATGKKVSLILKLCRKY